MGLPSTKDANFFFSVGGVACPPAEQVANSGGLLSLYNISCWIDILTNI